MYATSPFDQVVITRNVYLLMRIHIFQLFINMSKSKANSNQFGIVGVFAVDACSGEETVLTGQTGEFGTVGNTYDANAHCQWQIEVGEGLVR